MAVDVMTYIHAGSGQPPMGRIITGVQQTGLYQVLDPTNHYAPLSPSGAVNKWDLRFDDPTYYG